MKRTLFDYYYKKPKDENKPENTPDSSKRVKLDIIVIDDEPAIENQTAADVVVEEQKVQVANIEIVEDMNTSPKAQEQSSESQTSPIKAQTSPVKEPRTSPTKELYTSPAKEPTTSPATKETPAALAPKNKKRKVWIKDKVGFTEKKLSLDSDPVTITLLSNFFTTRTLTHELVGLLTQDAEVDLAVLTNRVVKKLNDGVAADDVGGVIEQIAKRVNYGPCDELPVYRWEVDIQFIPAEFKQVVLERRQWRQDAQSQLVEIWKDMSGDEKKRILSGRKMTAEEKRQMKAKEKEQRALEKEREKEQRQLEREREREQRALEKERERELRALEKAKKLPSAKKDKQIRLDTFFQKVTKTPVRVVEKSEFDKIFPPLPPKQDVTYAPIIPVGVKLSDKLDIGMDGDVNVSFKRGKLVKGGIHGSLADDLKHLPNLKGVRVKLLQFHENYRPAYFGTIKRVEFSGRRPFARIDILDYEFDSDDEWDAEDAEEGDECLSEEEDESEDEETEEDAGWLVPNGYLSDDEGEGGQAEKKTEKRKIEILVPEIGGMSNENVISLFKGEFYDPTLVFSEEKQTPLVKKKKQFPEEFTADLMRLVEGDSLDKIVEKFHELGSMYSLVPKGVVKSKIKEISERVKVDGKNVWRARSDNGEN